MATLTRQQMRDRLLKERGLKSHTPTKHHRSKLRPEIKPTFDGKPKTPLMKYLEAKYGEAIEDVLMSGSLTVVAKHLGNEVDVTTLSKWIKRFKLRYNETNLPTCVECKRHGPACDAGVCYVLLDLERYDLVEAKKKEVLDGQSN